ncbi:hypothetical protein RFI_26280 [Reticulomyxa filosa]|uniref:Uncharacterized protein n=1 Tax=Reticulomyxa filosa TaxID=46433 RepID=X6MBP1_RETFI|nr:hypothetical protein RFI_26280 [Reticulomyxa filosa]|eukprot:ETO11096.1 hypothetical protein RFI_26280 [Reticulomyxa filosa]
MMKLIRIWNIETAKQLNVFKGCVNSVKYGSNELINTTLSGSNDESVRLWNIRSQEQIQVPMDIQIMYGLTIYNTIRFWDIRSNKNELYVIEGDKEDDGIMCIKFISLKKKERMTEMQGKAHMI